MVKNPHIVLDVYDYSGNKLCSLFDSKTRAKGQAYDIVYTQSINGTKTITFSLPFMHNRKRNFRWDAIKSEYQLRQKIGTFTDWFIIHAPKKTKNARAMTNTVTCDHISTALKTKNLYLIFDDENGIGTIKELAERALRNTGWGVGICDAFFEKDGETEKIRTIKSDGKAGALQLITNICNLFKAYPVYDGNTRKVNLYSLNNKKSMYEMTMGRDIDSLSVEINSDDIITRMYVEGEYGEDGYIGIDDVNPTKLSFLMNFDYYREIGAFKPKHEEALTAYYADALEVNTAMRHLMTQIIEKENDLNTLWGQASYVMFKIEEDNTLSETPVVVGEVIADKQKIAEGDEILMLYLEDIQDGKGIEKYDTVTAGADGALSFDAEKNYLYAIKFVTKASGKIGAKESAVEAKQRLIDNLVRRNEDILAGSNPSEEQLAENNEAIGRYQREIEELYCGSMVFYTDTRADKDKTYYYRIAGYNEFGTGSMSSAATTSMNGTTATTPSSRNARAGNSLPPPPETVTAKKQQDGTIRLSFSRNALADGHKVYRAESAEGEYTEIASISLYDEETDGLYFMMHQAAKISDEASVLYISYNAEADRQEEIEATFHVEMGDLLKEGYWNNTNYAAGQEQFLYDDAVDLMKRMSYPEVKYQVSRVSQANQLGKHKEELELNMNIRLYDPDLKVNDVVFISEISNCLDAPENDTVKLSNEDLSISGVTFASILSRMTRLADLIDQKNALYERADAISGDGSIQMQRLEGQINVLKNSLMSTVSSWYTDERGNLIFENTTGRSAMMLTGDGFMIANGRTEDGAWNWRTFGTGEGFTADAITTGYLSADRIRAGTITVDHLSSGIGASIDLSQNNTIIAGITDKIYHTGDKPPTSPKHGDLWMDTSDKRAISMRRYTETQDENGQVVGNWVFVTADPSEITNLQDQVSQIRIDKDGIESRVNGVSDDLTRLESRVSQTEEHVTNTFTRIDNIDGTIQTVTSWQRFDENGMTLGKSDSRFKTRLSNESLSFIEDENEVAYIRSHRMYIGNAQATESLSIGKEEDGCFVWNMVPTRANGNVIGGMAQKWQKGTTYGEVN